MISLMNDAYLYLKSFHLIAAFAWMAGLFYLPRLYIYHAEVGAGTPQSETFKVMERRLLKAIMNPAMIVTVGLGLWIAFATDYIDWRNAPWLHLKIALVVGLLVIHGFLAKWRKDFEADRIPHSTRFFRIINEIPTLLLIGIVLLVIVKPF
ncbi:protoporphyrinogen oxidase HemJ [Rhodomicrobium sp. Az07]|uniref:protoporphyrinogen oxidase HemJ n=1 Tax=Rhodomicrobium sp. Az07 TaxID=2839034 RepID=UPI001BEAF03A|nr:protoporphyrinogen oxidase HemJ [Rhodomicrobium sp. Az07]MBT3069396.1 protoporphyrinogen oxidase HemJ [Rhodomicrobium sp. Az07]